MENIPNKGDWLMEATKEAPKQEAPKEKEAAPVVQITAKEYAKSLFTLEGDEFKIEPRPVGENRFRVLIWSKEKDDVCVVPDHKIKRSFYVILKKDGASWTHDIS